MDKTASVEPKKWGNKWFLFVMFHPKKKYSVCVCARKHIYTIILYMYIHIYIHVYIYMHTYITICIYVYITSNHLTALAAQKLRYPIFGIWKQLDWWWKCLTLGSHPTNHRIVISYRDVLDFRPMNMILLGDILGYHGDILGYTMILLWCCKLYSPVGDWTT